jgi:dual specificity tyrosine-phosphorylation-regulated kinase 2/3/4
VSKASDHSIEFPIDSSAAKQEIIASKYLTDFERTEVEEYKQIYYLAKNSDKNQPSKLERLVNNGFDNEEGYYKIQLEDHIAYRF